MRLFQNLHEAESEIRRDLAKGTPVTSSRVQQRTGLELKGRERLGYEYAIESLSDVMTVKDLIEFGKERGFPLYLKDPEGMGQWVASEILARLDPNWYRDRFTEPTEKLNPALISTLEGNHPSYTYTERLTGAVNSLARDIKRSPDTRRAFWPIFRYEDAIRASEPTRIPCSLGYQTIVREGASQPELMLFYLERSCDFDNFWLSDVFLARAFQLAVAESTGYAPGQLVHFIISFHSFQVEDQEIY